MRLGFVLLAFLSAVHGAEAANFSIYVPPPLVRLVPNYEELPKVCNTTRIVGACTSFAGEKLFCECEIKGASQQWRITARAQYVPVLYLGSIKYRQHEELHIRDIHADLTQYLDQLTAEEFASEESCETFAAGSAERFRSLMDDFKIRSNTKRDPRLGQAYDPKP